MRGSGFALCLLITISPMPLGYNLKTGALPSDSNGTVGVSDTFSSGGLDDSNQLPFAKLSASFQKYHKDPTNVALHLVTSPLGLFSAFTLLNKATRTNWASLFLVAVYAASLVHQLEVSILLATALPLLACAVIAARLDLQLVLTLVLLVAAYGGQDLAHIIAGEPTYQSSYSSQGLSGFVAMFYEHCYFLMPLCVDAAPPSLQILLLFTPLLLITWGCFFIDSSNRLSPFSFGNSRVLQAKMTGEQELNDLAMIRKWAMDHSPSSNTSTHWWYTDLSEECMDAFKRICEGQTMTGMFRQIFGEDQFGLLVVTGMNEVYVTGKSRAGSSDQVFFTKHIDGPYGLFPFCSVFRCIVGMDDNTEFTTHFPTEQISATVSTGEILGFDFHREMHYITQDEQKPNKQHRVTLKVHMCAYPKALPWMGKALAWLSVRYNITFRALFLYTLKPQTLIEKAVGKYAVVGGTILFNSLEQYVGFANLVYLGTLALIGKFVSYPIFLVGTSFVHYTRYIVTYYWRKGVSYGNFKRDVLLFKSLALVQLAVLYIGAMKTHALALDYISLVMIALGYGVSIAATEALGIDGTYFGIELGYVKADYRFVTKFPYNVLPHPMILGQVFALLGVHKVIVQDWPYLVPVHITLYLIHLTQESYDIWNGPAWFKQQAVKQD
jgi:hypothetical protein